MTTQQEYGTTELFRELDKQYFPNYAALTERVIEIMNTHLESFVPPFTYRDALSWATRMRWINHVGNNVYFVDMSYQLPAQELANIANQMAASMGWDFQKATIPDRPAGFRRPTKAELLQLELDLTQRILGLITEK